MSFKRSILIPGVLLASLLSNAACAVADDLPEEAQRRLGKVVRPGLFAGCSSESVFAVALSPDGRRAATGHQNETRIWNLANGELERIISNRSTVHTVAFSPDGRRLAWGGWGNSFALEDLESGERLFEPDVGICVGFTTSFSADGRWLLSDGSGARGNRSDSVLIWDLEKRQQVHEIRVEGNLWRGALTPDAATAVTGDSKGNVIAWDLKTGKRRWATTVEGGAVLDLSMTADGRRIAAVSSYPRPYVVILDTASGAELRRIDHARVVRAVAISADGRMLATGGNGDGIRVFDTRTGEQVNRVFGHPGGISSLEFSRDGLRLISGGFYGSALLWDVKKLTLPKQD